MMKTRTRSLALILVVLGMAVAGASTLGRTAQSLGADPQRNRGPGSTSVSQRDHETGAEGRPHAIVFASYADDAEQLRHTAILTESVRRFGGTVKDAPVWVFVPERVLESQQEILAKVDSLGADVLTSETPADASAFPFASKVFAAAVAEKNAEGRARVLAWMDEDTIVLSDPKEFDLAEGVSFGYRPVMHQRIGSLYDLPVDTFWSRVYETLSVPESAVFPVVTPADEKTIRAYFNAGMLVVRPERGILRKWAASFSVLYRDALLVDMCQEDVYKRIFLHQAALAGAVLSLLESDELMPLSDRINYPIFFHERFESRREFYNIEGVATLRYDVYFRDPQPGWSDKIQGPSEVVEWLRERFPNE